MAFPVRVWRYLCRPGAEQFSCEPGSAVIVVIYACAVACGRSFTVLSDRAVLSVFGVFSPTLLFPFIIFVFIVVTFIGYYCCYYFHKARGFHRAPGSV